MTEKEQLFKDFSRLIFILSFFREDEDAELWVAPLGEGKWTVRDMITHIMLWDQYFLEGAIEKIASHQPLTLKHTDFNEFNQNAIEFAKDKSMEEIIDLTIHFREEILRHLRSLNEEDFAKEYVDGDGNKFTITGYLKDFIWHDKHHIDQIGDRLQ